MSDHKFEKQVGQKLADLRITPSTESWEKIEREMRKDRRRPAPVFWLPLLLIGLGAIGYFVFTPGDTGNAQQVASVEKTMLPVPKNTHAPSVFASPVTENTTTPPTDNNSITEKNITSKNITQRSNIAGSNNNNFVSVKKITKHNPGKENREDKNRIETKTKEAETKSNRIKGDTAEEINNDSEAANNNNDLKETIIAEQPVVKNKTSSPLKQPAEAGTTGSVPKKQDTKKKSSKWSFGVSGSAGVSAVTEGKLLDFSNPQIDVVAAPVSNLVSPAMLPSSGPSKLYPGFSFSLGITTKYELSKRLSLSASLNYLRTTIVTKVGYKIQSGNSQSNSLGNSYFAAERSIYYLQADNYSSEDYYNKFHFIELPIELNTRINKSKKLPIFWNAGVSVAQLIGSNSLHYDKGAGVYYMNDDLLNRTQVAALTGFSFQLLNKTKTPVWIGPSVRYNISRALKKEVSTSNKHFMGAGIDVKWFIK